MSMTAYQSLLLEFTPRPIRTEREYRRASKYIESRMQPHPPKAEGDLLEMLSTLVMDYESRMAIDADVAPGDMLAHLMDACGRTQADVARATGISRATLSSAIAGRRGISKANAAKLADYFHVSPALFLPGSRD